MSDVLREIPVKLILRSDGAGGVRCEIVGTGGRLWMVFRIAPSTLNLNQRVVDICEPLLKRAQKEFKRYERDLHGD